MTTIDRTLADLGVHRVTLPIPFSQAGGSVNVYLLEDLEGKVTLFDTGLFSEPCKTGLEQGLADAGWRVEDVGRVLVSHGHVDHFGLARYVQERSGARVFVPRGDWNKVLASSPPPPFEEPLQRLGVPRKYLAHLEQARARSESFAQRLETVEPLEPGSRLSFARFEAEVLPFPGHTPGLICLHVPAHRVLFSDDHVLQGISPNPVLEPRGDDGKSTTQALIAYLQSARRLCDLDLDWLFPGHGDPFQNHRSVLDSLFGFYEKRQSKMLRVLEERPRTALELVEELFGTADSLQLFLMLSEVVGNVEVLEAQGRVTHDDSEVPIRYRVVPSAAEDPRGSTG